MNAPEQIASRLPALGCPACGGHTRPGPGGRHDCDFCGGHFLDAVGGGVPTVTPARHVGAATAYHTATGWLRAQAILARPAPRPGDISLLYVPYWRYEATLSGWLLTRPHRQARAPVPAASGRRGASAGDESQERLADLLRRASGPNEAQRLAEFLAARPPGERDAPAGGGADTPDRGLRTSALLRPVAWSGPGCDVRDFGLVGVHRLVSDDRLTPFDFAAAERTGTVCQVTGSVATVRRLAERAILNQLAGSQQLLRRRLSFVREKVELVYYPLYVFKYRARGLACRLVLDGARGELLAGSRPAAQPDGLWRLFCGTALWSCVWSASAQAGAGCLPALWLGDGWARNHLASPRELALRAQAALEPPRVTVEEF